MLSNIFGRKAAARERATLAALSKSQAIIEFNLDGTIITANENFCAAMGYALDEIRGKHHRMFVDPSEAESVAYRQFWEALRTGKFDTAEYKRFGKGGKEIWIQASYNPVVGDDGKPEKVVKIASDITAITVSDPDITNLHNRTPLGVFDKRLRVTVAVEGGGGARKTAALGRAASARARRGRAEAPARAGASPPGTARAPPSARSRG